MADLVFPSTPVSGVLGQEFLPSNYDLVLYRGDYFPISVTLKDSNGVAINLTGYTAKAQIKKNYSDNAPYDFTVTMDAPNGKVNLVLTSTVSETILAGNYIWDFQVTNPSGNVRTYLAGDVVVYDEVTR